MKVLVTGANGLLGSKLVALLGGADDVDLLATSKGDPRNPISSGSYEPLDITNPEEVTNVISKFKPDVVINTAAMTQVDDCESQKTQCDLINTTAVGYLVDACNATSAYFLQVSTDFIFDGTKKMLDEVAKPNPVNYYGLSKLRAEELVKSKSSKWGIARTVLVYGFVSGMRRSNIVLWVKEKLEKKEPIKVVNDQWRTPTLAEDLAAGCWLLAKTRTQGIYHISGEELLTPYEIAIRTAAYFGLDNSLIEEVDSSIFKQPAKRPPATGFDITKAKKELGYSPHDFEEGLELIKAQLDSGK